MLPAISSDLPAYLLPPTVSEEGRRTTPDGFGPATQVNITAEKSVDAQSQQAGIGLYGPDGQFVETTARQESWSDTPSDGASGQSFTADASADGGGDTAPAALDAPPVLSSPTQSSERDRDLALDNFDAAIPPAAREELRALADRAQRKSSEKVFSTDEYKKLADLMMRLGRHPDAMRAMEQARALEQNGQPQPESDAPSMLSMAGVTE